MEIKEIFKRPKRKIVNKDVFNFKDSRNLYCYTLFVAGTKINNKEEIEIDSDSVLSYGVAPFVKKHGIFSDRLESKNLISLSKKIYKEASYVGFDGIIMGFYNHISNEIIYDAYFEDFYKLNSSNLIDCYFTLKLKEMNFDKELFEREYFDIVEHIAGNNHLPVTIDQFMLFKSKLEVYIRSGLAEPNRGMAAISEGLIRIMEATFTNVETPQEQLTVSRFLVQLGCLNCKITTDRKTFKPLSDNLPTEPCEIVFVPNNRFLKIYSK